ncbi:MAG: hypothetical protein ACFIN4_00545 [Candidatus Walczuchella monophlebidarum]
MNLSITKNVVATFCSVFILCGMFLNMANSDKDYCPISFQAKLLEPLILFLIDELAIQNIGNPMSKLYFTF